MERKEKKLKRILPPKEVLEEEVETRYLTRSEWQSDPDLLKTCVKVILPNFCIKGRNVYFILENEKYIVVDKIFMEDEFMIESEDQLISVRYRIYQDEDPRGLRCEIMIPEKDDIFYADYQFIGKLVEMDLLNMNPAKTYQLMDHHKEVEERRKKNKVIRKMSQDQDD